MQSISAQLDGAFRRAIAEAFGIEADPLIAPGQNEKFGDYQCNAAMGLARQVSQQTGQKTNPRAVAERIRAKLDLGEMAAEVSIAGPGFINVVLSPAWLGRQLETLAGDARLGIEPVRPRQRVVIDYSGPNIAKELHVGHLRSTILGDAASRALEFQGQEVIRQNHIGDWGTQFGMLIANLRRQGAEGESHIEDLEAFYVEAKRRFDEDPQFAEEARRTVVRLQGGGAEELALWRRIVEETRRHYQPLYERLGVTLRPEHERGESFYNPMLAEVVAELKPLSQESQGAMVVQTERFENPLIIQKTDGGYLYATTDLAALRHRTRELRAQRIVYFVDARQSQHFAQVFEVARRAGWAAGVSLEHAAFGTMLGPDGRPFRTKAGGTVKLKELLDEAEERAYALVSQKNPQLGEEQRRAIARAVGIGAVKYADLSKDRTSDYLFSFDVMLSLEGNTAPYMQYAYARIRSIFRKAAGEGCAGGSITLQSPFEVALAKHALRLGEIVDLVGRELKPHHLCGYLYELATRFSAFYENCPVIQSPEPVRSSRLALCQIAARTMGLGLDLLGIEHPEQM